jgi:SAM-dependent methyltransferase
MPETNALTINLPQTLWSKPAGGGKERLSLPGILVETYRELLLEMGLLAEAQDQTPTDDGPQGGITVQETERHFAKNFSGSCARIALVALDPHDIFAPSRDWFVRFFSGGHVHLLDIPCGAGAASATLLCLVAELRKQKILPTHPLSVTVLGGDISPPARAIKARLYRKLQPLLRPIGIQVRFTISNWDVEDDMACSAIANQFARMSPRCASSLIVALNFSGFLSRKVKECQSRLREILRHGCLKRSHVFWVEPQTNAATRMLFPNLREYVFEKVKKLEPVWESLTRTSQCVVKHPVQETGEFDAHVAAALLKTAN